MNTLAPIVMFVYNRPQHTIKTIEALKENELAKNSDLFIYSDSFKTDKDREKVEEVRRSLKGITGFNKVKIIEANKNKGLANSIIYGVNEVLDEYGKVIVIEDDIIVSNTFLNVMNKMLDEFNGREDIWSISGYTPNIKFPSEYKEDVFLSIRGSSWGWGTWKNRWEKIDWNISDYDKFIKDKNEVKSFNLGGNDLSRMLVEQMNGRIDSWAIRYYYNQFKYNMYTVYPRKSLIYNNGFDMTGTHGANKKLASKLNTYNSSFIPIINNKIEVNKKIEYQVKKIYDLTFDRYIAVFLRKIGLINVVKSIRNRINLFKGE